MSFNIRIPNITANSTQEQIRQVHSYLYQVVEQLNWALNTIESASDNATTSTTTSVNSDSQTFQEETSLNTFNSIKGLIIKSADIVNAYYEEIDNLLKLSGEYVAEASFPEGSATFIQNTTSTLNANSESITQHYTNIQKIESDIKSLDKQFVDTKSYIRTGHLYDDGDIPIYGIEVGQETEKNGKKIFNQYARFIANKLSFFDSNGYEAAYISDRKLFINNVEIKYLFKMGGFEDTVQSDKSIVTKWVE